MSVQVDTWTVLSPRVESILPLVSRIGDEERLLFRNVTWDEYQELLDELGERRRVLVSYSERVLEVMPLSHRHEHYKETIGSLIRVLTEELDVEMEPAGSTTLQLESLAQGAEPDTSFFIQHAREMMGKETHNLLTDPPPDLVVEVDIFHPTSSRKKAIYARFGIPEFWRYDGKRLTIYQLERGNYEEVARSIAFPFLQTADLAAFIERGKTVGHNALVKSFREWVRANKP
jgi:Uma2 family endonuclease